MLYNVKFILVNFQTDQAYILRYPQEVQTVQTIGRPSSRASTSMESSGWSRPGLRLSGAQRMNASIPLSISGATLMKDTTNSRYTNLLCGLI